MVPRRRRRWAAARRCTRLALPPVFVTAAACSQTFVAHRPLRQWSGHRASSAAQQPFLSSARTAGRRFLCLCAGAFGARLALPTLGCNSWRAGRARASRCAASQEASAAVEEEQLRTLCANLMQQVGKAKKSLAAGSDEDGPDGGNIDLRRFSHIMTELGVRCEEAEKEQLFQVLSAENQGGLKVSGLRAALRNSSLIQGLYSDGVKNSLLTLIPAAVLAVAFAITKGPTAGLDFVAGYIIEDSLSVDNLFVFLIIFRYFKVPSNLQKVCLDVGIYGAVILRALFIYVGLAAVNTFKPILLVFAAILLYSAISALLGNEEEDVEDGDTPPGIVQSVIEVLPMTDEFVGEKLYINDEATGQFLLTPLALSIVTIELSDILFAVDSVPAVFAVTEDPLIVFTSNISAILGLRSLYQVLSIAVQDLVYLEKSVSVILAFVGLKLGLEVAGFDIPSEASLAFILLTLGAGIGLSLLAEQEGRQLRPKTTALQRFIAAIRQIFMG